MLLATRLTLGLLILIAIGTQLTIHLRLGFSPLNFFSYFTNLANGFAAFVLLRSAARQIGGSMPSPAFDRLRHLSVIYMTVVGVVFATLLRNVDLGTLRPWINILLHYIAPAVVAVEWWWQPPRSVLTMRDLAVTLVGPLLYLGYSLGRGAATGWYPYPFLNPTLTGGYAQVAAYAAGIVVVFGAAGLLLMRVSKGLRPRT